MVKADDEEDILRSVPTGVNLTEGGLRLAQRREIYGITVRRPVILGGGMPASVWDEWLLGIPRQLRLPLANVCPLVYPGLCRGQHEVPSVVLCPPIQCTDTPHPGTRGIIQTISPIVS